jgi:phage tail sheath protein FI
VFADPAVSVSGVLGTLNAVRSALDELGAAIAAGSANRWRATRQGLRLALVPTFGGANAGLGSTVSTAAGFNVGAANHPFNGADNVAAYSLGRLGGVGGLGVRQASDPADEGLDGTKPELLQYTRAFQTLESTLASWNLMVLPRAAEQSDNERRALWAQAGASCARRRAILLVDPDAGWTTIPAASAGADSIKIGADTRNSAVFWPRLLVPQSGSPAPKTIDPSGSIAGLMARTDGRFGVWTAPAGLEATLRGVSGLSRVMSDEENGVLNPKALNAIRLFPSGVVCWGARMMAGSDDTGNIDDKYIPVRRTMLFIEESLYRGLKFAVFQPNAEPLWASIRLAAGSFMNGLMRQGAFASRNKADAYYVLCDGTTTTETDRNLGIVNVVVAFAPLKPAEFVVLTVQQIAGQVQV